MLPLRAWFLRDQTMSSLEQAILLNSSGSVYITNLSKVVSRDGVTNIFHYKESFLMVLSRIDPYVNMKIVFFTSDPTPHKLNGTTIPFQGNQLLATKHSSLVFSELSEYHK